MKIYTVQKSRVDRKCGRCGVEIPVGSRYFYFQHKFSPVSYRCEKHYPRQSELTTSDKLSTVYSIQERIEDLIGAFDYDDIDAMVSGLEDLSAELETMSEEARQVAEEYNTSADNMEEHFPSGSYQIDEIREKSQACEEWADELESAKGDVDEAINDLTYKQAEYEDFDEDDEDVETSKDEILEDCRQIVEDATSKVEEAAGSLGI